MAAQTPTFSEGHTPISNEPEEVITKEEELLSDPPLEGLDPGSQKVTEEGLEVVDRYNPITTELGRRASERGTALAAEAQRQLVQELPELYAAPDTAGLADVGEASFGSVARLEAVI